MSKTIEIQYCVPCGHLERAIGIQRSILEHFGQRVEGVKLKTGAHGVFVIRAGEDQIYEKTQEYDVNTIIEAIEARV